MNQPIAIVMSEVFLRRLTPSLTPFARKMQDYRVLSIHRPIDELGPMLQDLQPSGLITEWLPEKTDQLLNLKLDVPTIVVATDRIIPDILSADVDDWAVGREAALTFAQTGFKSLACLGNATPYSDQRIEGFKESFSTTDLPFSIHIESGFEDTRYSESFQRPSVEMKKWLERLPKPVGIFAVHDPLGRFLCSACTQLGLEIPTEVSVIGANNDPLVCGLTYPMLSSVSIPWDTLGEQVATAMQKMVAGEKLHSDKPILVQPSGVILRHSANHLALEDPLLKSLLASSARSSVFQEELLKENSKSTLSAPPGKCLVSYGSSRPSNYWQKPITPCQWCRNCPVLMMLSEWQLYLSGSRETPLPPFAKSFEIKYNYHPFQKKRTASTI